MRRVDGKSSAKSAGVDGVASGSKHWYLSRGKLSNANAETSSSDASVDAYVSNDDVDDRPKASSSNFCCFCASIWLYTGAVS